MRLAMDLLAFVQSHPFVASLFAATLLPLLGFVPRLRVLGTPRATLFAALWVIAVDVAGSVLAVRGVLARTFESTELGWVREADLDPTAVAEGLELLVGIQGLAAIALLVLVPLALVAAWRAAPRTSMLERAAPIVATLAIAIPVAAGSIATLAMLDTIATPHDSIVETTWVAWNIIELGKWLVIALGAMGLMAATPIVVEAAARGLVVGRRGYLGAQVLLLLGFGAWALSRLCAEDVARGPIDRIAKGDVSAMLDAKTSGLDAVDVATIDLPRGAWCHVDEIDPAIELAVPLVLTRSVERRLGDERSVGVSSWRTHASRLLEQANDRRPVLVAALDMHITADDFGPYLRAARQLGIEELAIVTFTDDRERTLTLGEVYTRRPCVLVRTDLDHAREYTLPGVWWSSLSHRLTEESIQPLSPAGA
jgi:hypothetical protein